MTGRELFDEYCRAKGVCAEPSAIEPFGDGPQLADSLLQLILSGRKRATCWACLDEQPPAPGTLSVITDWAGENGCVLETVRAGVLPFCEVTWEMARREGEDETFESWRENHIAFFTRESAAEGYTFSMEMPVIFEQFRVVWPEKYADTE